MPTTTNASAPAVTDRAAALAQRPRYTVRKQSSGYAASVTFYVYDTARKGRVSVHAARTSESAQHDADSLNVGALILDADVDPRPYATRRAEAEAAYKAARG